MALISFLFFQCKTAVDVDTCHVISNISCNCLPLFYEIENSLIQTLSFRDDVHSHFYHAKQPMVISFSTPPLIKTAILRWENFLKFRPMVHCGANFQRRQYRPG